MVYMADGAKPTHYRVVHLYPVRENLVRDRVGVFFYLIYFSHKMYGIAFSNIMDWAFFTLEHIVYMWTMYIFCMILRRSDTLGTALRNNQDTSYYICIFSTRASNVYCPDTSGESTHPKTPSLCVHRFIGSKSQGI